MTDFATDSVTDSVTDFVTDFGTGVSDKGVLLNGGKGIGPGRALAKSRNRALSVPVRGPFPEVFAVMP